MEWTGEWHNQHGSVLKITDDGDGRIVATFRSARDESRVARAEPELIKLPWVHAAETNADTFERVAS